MLEPSRLADRKTLQLVLIDNALANAFINLVSGTILVGFIRQIGGNDYWIGLFTFVPSICGLMQLPGAVLGRRLQGYRSWVYPLGFLWRFFHAPLLLLALKPGWGEARLLISLIAVGVASLCVQLCAPIYEDWVAEMIPPSSRATFYARRMAWSGGVGAAAGLLGGLILDHFIQQSRPETGYAIAFGLGLFFSVVSIAFFAFVGDRRRIHREEGPVRESFRSLKIPLKDPMFRKVLVFLAAFVFGQAFMGNLLTAYAIEVLKLPFVVLQTLGLVQAMTQVVVSQWWGQMGDRYGSKPLLVLLCCGITLTPWIWFLTVPNDLWRNVALLTPQYIFSGLIWAGVGVIQFNFLVKTCRDDQRATYLATGQSLMAVMAAISPLIGAAMLAQLRPITGSAASAYLWVLATCMALRFCSLAFLKPVREREAVPVRAALRALVRRHPD